MSKIAFTATIAILMAASSTLSMPTAAGPIGHSEPLAREVNTCSDPSQALTFLRAFSVGSTDHFYTTNAAQMQGAIQSLGYVRENPVGQIFPTQGVLTVPLYRMFSIAGSDHFYTTSLSERNTAIGELGYGDEGIAGYVYPQQECGAVPLYRAVNAHVTDHFYTQDLGEKDRAVANAGYSDEGIAAYVLPMPTA